MADAADVLSNLELALYAKFIAVDGEGSHNAFYTAVNGRLFEGFTEDADFPYAVYEIISSPKEKTFSEEYRNTLIQFDFFSTTSSTSEINDIYAHASALFDECSLSITGSKLVWMKEVNCIGPSREYIEATESGFSKVWHISADFEVRTSLD